MVWMLPSIFPHLSSQTIVFVRLKNKEQNFEVTPATADNSSGVTRVPEQNKILGLNHFWWITYKLL